MLKWKAISQDGKPLVWFADSRFGWGSRDASPKLFDSPEQVNQAVHQLTVDAGTSHPYVVGPVQTPESCTLEERIDVLEKQMLAIGGDKVGFDPRTSSPYDAGVHRGRT